MGAETRSKTDRSPRMGRCATANDCRTRRAHRPPEEVQVTRVVLPGLFRPQARSLSARLPSSTVCRAHRSAQPPLRVPRALSIHPSASHNLQRASLRATHCTTIILALIYHAVRTIHVLCWIHSTDYCFNHPPLIPFPPSTRRTLICAPPKPPRPTDMTLSVFSL